MPYDRITIITGRIVYASVGLILVVYHVTAIIQKQYQSKAVELNTFGFKEKGLTQFRKAMDIPIYNAALEFQYAKALYNSAQLNEAKRVLQKSDFISSESALLLANILSEAGEREAAISEYKLSIFMEPSKMTPRYYLLEYFLKLKDTVHAKYWATSILNMHIKIPSTTTQHLLKRSSDIMSTLN